VRAQVPSRHLNTRSILIDTTGPPTLSRWFCCPTTKPIPAAFHGILGHSSDVHHCDQTRPVRRNGVRCAPKCGLTFGRSRRAKRSKLLYWAREPFRAVNRVADAWAFFRLKGPHIPGDRPWLAAEFQGTSLAAASFSKHGSFGLRSFSHSCSFRTSSYPDVECCSRVTFLQNSTRLGEDDSVSTTIALHGEPGRVSNAYMGCC
jgi:hypothetical protein